VPRIVTRRRESNEQIGTLEFTIDTAVTELILARLGRPSALPQVPDGHFVVEFLHRLQYVGRIHIADHRQDDVRGPIVILVPAHERVAVDAIKNLPGSDPPAPDPVLFVGQRKHGLTTVGHRAVELPPCLLLDRANLLFEHFGIKERVLQGIRLDPQALAPVVGGHDRVIGGVIIGSGGIEDPAELLGLPADVFRIGMRRRAVEEHVLDHMADPRQFIGLVEVARLDPGHQCGGPGPGDWPDQEREPVVELVADHVFGDRMESPGFRHRLPFRGRRGGAATASTEGRGHHETSDAPGGK